MCPSSAGEIRITGLQVNDDVFLFTLYAKPSAYLTNALSSDVAPTADLIYCKVPRIVKEKKQSLTRPNYPCSCRKGPYTKEAVNCKSSCWLSWLSSNLIM